MKKEKAISMMRGKVKLDDYNNRMFKDGLFDPICPADYNFLTGKQEPIISYQSGGIDRLSLARRVNGSPIFRN